MLVDMQKQLEDLREWLEQSTIDSKKVNITIKQDGIILKYCDYLDSADLDDGLNIYSENIGLHIDIEENMMIEYNDTVGEYYHIIMNTSEIYMEIV